MTYIDEITLDFNAITNFPIIAAKQNDVDSRILLIHFTKNGEAAEIDKNLKVGYRIRKPDGHIVLNNGVNNKDNTVTITLTQECLSAAGRAYADVYFHDNGGKLLSTTSFIINIMASPNTMTNAAASSDEFLYLMSFLNDAEDIINESQAWAEGKKGSKVVVEGEEQYHNNSKYYSEIAQGLINSSASYLFFDIDYLSGELWIFRPESDSFSSEMDFELNDNGELVVKLDNDQ